VNKDLEPAIAELRAVLKKHDVTGLIIVGNKTHVDFSMEVEASWSCAKLTHGEDGHAHIRIKALSQDFPNKEDHKEVLENTIGMFVTFNDVMRHLTEGINTILVRASKQVSFSGHSRRVG
jgi:hypothetical protein